MFSNNLKTLRLKNNMNQTELGKQIGVDQRTISAWENGICEPDIKTLNKLKEHFSITVDDLIK